MRPLKFSADDHIAADAQELLSAGHDVADEMGEIVSLLRNRQFGDVTGHHPLKGKLAGWYACDLGEQDGITGPRMVYRVSGNKLHLLSVGFHDAAYEKAQARKRA